MSARNAACACMYQRRMRLWHFVRVHLQDRFANGAFVVAAAEHERPEAPVVPSWTVRLSEAAPGHHVLRSQHLGFERPTAHLAALAPASRNTAAPGPVRGGGLSLEVAG